MKVYQGKSKSLLTLSIIIGIFAAIIVVMLVLVGVKPLTVLFSVIFAFAIHFCYKGMILRIAVDEEKVVISRPLGKKTIRFADIAFCMVHGIDETESIIYAFVKKRMGNRIGVKGIKQQLTFEEVVRIINKSQENIDLDINFNMAQRIPVSLVENTEELKNRILQTLGGHQKKILNQV